MDLRLEVCTETAQGAADAVRIGAARIELCARLDLDGLTPGLDELRATLAAVDVPVHAMVRPRPGDFVHGEAELVEMERSIEALLNAGAHGLVLGVLRPDGDVDGVALARLLRVAGDAPVTFHRAFDVVRDPAAALEQLIDHGVPRVLTSGGPPTAWEGLRAARAHRRGRRAPDRDARRRSARGARARAGGLHRRSRAARLGRVPPLTDATRSVRWCRMSP